MASNREEDLDITDYFARLLGTYAKMSTQTPESGVKAIPAGFIGANEFNTGQLRLGAAQAAAKYGNKTASASDPEVAREALDKIFARNAPKLADERIPLNLERRRPGTSETVVPISPVKTVAYESLIERPPSQAAAAPTPAAPSKSLGERLGLPPRNSPEGEVLAAKINAPFDAAGQAIVDAKNAITGYDYRGAAERNVKALMDTLGPASESVGSAAKVAGENLVSAGKSAVEVGQAAGDAIGPKIGPAGESISNFIRQAYVVDQEVKDTLMAPVKQMGTNFADAVTRDAAEHKQKQYAKDAAKGLHVDARDPKAGRFAGRPENAAYTEKSINGLNEQIARFQEIADTTKDPARARQARANVEGLRQELKNTWGVEPPAAPPESPVDSHVPPSPEAIKAAVTSPAVPNTVKQGTIARATDDPAFVSETEAVIKGLKTDRDSAMTKSIANNAAEQEALGNIRRTQQSAGELKAQEERAKFAHEQSRVADNARALDTAGIRTDVADSKYNLVAAKNAELFTQMYSLGDEIAADKQVSFLDDPATWFANQFTLPGKIAQYNAMALKVNRGSEFLKNATSLAASAINANSAKHGTQSGEQSRLAAERALQDAALNAMNTELAAAKANGASMKEQEAIMQHYRQNVMSAAQLGDAQRARASNEEFQRTQTEFMNKQREFMTAKQIEEMDRKREQDAQQAERDENYKKAARALFLPEPEKMTEKRAKTASKETKEALDIVVQSGGTILGRTPTQVLDNWKFVQAHAQKGTVERAEVNATYTPSQQKLIGLLAAEAADVKATLDAAKVPPDKVEAAVNEKVMETLIRMKNNPEKFPVTFQGEPTNFYKAEPMGKLIEVTLPGNMYNTAAAETITGNTGGKEVTPEMVLTTLGRKVARKEMSLSDAGKEVAAFYQQVIDNNNKTMKFTSMGYPVQDSYPVKIQGQAYDLANPVMASKVLMSIAYQQFYGMVQDAAGISKISSPSADLEGPIVRAAIKFDPMNLMPKEGK